MLTRFIKWLLSMIFGTVVHEATEQIITAANKPDTMTNAKVDTKFKDALDADLANKLQRNKSNNIP